MNVRYGSKAWAKREKYDLEFFLDLLKNPNEKWDDETTNLILVIRHLNALKQELDEVLE